MRAVMHRSQMMDYKTLDTKRLLVSEKDD